MLMNGGVLSVESQRIKWVILFTLLLDVPFIYEFGIHPLFGFLTALLVSWLIVEDAYDMLIDLRIAGGLLALVLLWNHLKGSEHLIMAIGTFLCFALGFFILRSLFIQYASLKQVEQVKETTSVDYVDSLQKGANVGMMPILGLATFLILSADMVFNPMQILKESAEGGASWAEMAWQTHLSMVHLGEVLYGSRIVILILLLGAILGALVLNIRRKIRQNKVPFYPCGAGDPLVLGIFAAMVGAECFYFGVMMLTLVFGIMVHGFRFYQSDKGRRI